MEYLTKDSDLIEKSKTLSQIKEKEDALKLRISEANIEAEAIINEARENGKKIVESSIDDAKSKSKVELKKWVEEATGRSGDIVHRADEQCDDLREQGQNNISKVADIIVNEVLEL